MIKSKDNTVEVTYNDTFGTHKIVVTRVQSVALTDENNTCTMKYRQWANLKCPYKQCIIICDFYVLY